MQQVCGFKDVSGYFHETEETCRISDIKIRLNEIQQDLLMKVSENYWNGRYYTWIGAVQHLLNNSELVQEYFSKMAELALLEPKPELIYPDIKVKWWQFWK